MRQPRKRINPVTGLFLLFLSALLLTSALSNQALLPLESGTSEAAAKSTVPVKTVGGTYPEQLTLTWAHQPATSIALTWRSAPSVKESAIELIPTASYKGFPDPKAKRITGRSSPFATDLGTMQIHEVEATGLNPNTSYTYRVGDGKGRWSGPYRFTTAPGDAAPFTFLFTTDTQSYPNAGAKNGYGIHGEILSKALKQYPNARFLLVGGDMVDAGNQGIHWENWFMATRGILPKLPIVPTLGNHDVMGNGEDRFTASFQLPKNGPSGEIERAYSFDYGNMHMAVLNSQGDLKKQGEWLRKDLAASKKMWKIVVIHRPPYQTHPSRSNPDVQRTILPIVDEAKVDLLLSGHDHTYLRTWPLKGGKRVSDGKGTVYVIGGTGGPKFYGMGNYSWMRVKWDTDRQIYSAVTVDGKKLTMTVTTRDGKKVDAFTLTK